MSAPPGLILAGGQSNRWQGRDKGLVEWQQQPLVEHVIKRLLPQVSGITVSCNQNVDRYQTICQRYASLSSTQSLPNILRDQELPGRGPLGGIYSYLKLARSLGNPGINSVVICCCDTPLLPENLVELLDSHMKSTGSLAVYPRFQNEHYWLTLLVEVESGYRAIQDMLENNTCHKQFSIKNWLKRLPTSHIELTSGDNFININDETALTHLNQLASTPRRIEVA